MKIITLTSDLGTSDHYVASLKAAILRQAQDVVIIDISHHIRPFDNGHAAYVLKSCFHEFPEGTVHVIAVDCEPILNFNAQEGVFPCVLEKDGQFIIANNNGFFGAFLGIEKDFKLRKIDDVLSNPKLLKFPSKNMFIPFAIRILNREKVSSFASEETNFKTAFIPEPAVEPNTIIGSIVYIDSYGNAITNIHQELFDKVGQNNPFVMYIRRKDYYLDTIRNTYNEVDPGERVAIFNERNFIEIAINRGHSHGLGGADKLLGLKLNDKIRIDFTPQGSKGSIADLLM